MAKRAKVAKRAADSDVEEEEAPYDKENDLNGGGGKSSKHGGKRKPVEDDDDEVVDEDDGDHEEEQAPSSPKRSKKKGANKKAAVESSPMKERHINPTGRPAEAGIISEVYVENFMCHRKLTVKLCRNVNFIHGQNGSGKSAILAAIQVCLGAGARRTHRARNLKDLVRKEAGANCTGAKLRVTLLNKGADGYQPDIYGDVITVERNISLTTGGFNGYKLLGADGREKSRSKKDLDAMLDQLNIQVENPVAVLDQEEAKKFLTGKAEDKYEFFTKATELERLDRCYASIQDNILEQRQVQERASENLSGSIENTKKLKKEWEQFQELDKLEVQAQELRANYGWSYHNELVEQLNTEMKTQQKYARALEKRRVELTNAEKNVNVTDDEEAKLTSQVNDLTEEAQTAADAKEELQNEIKADEAPVKQKEREMQVLNRELAQAKKNLKGAQRRLDHTRKQIIESQGNAREEERARTRQIAQTESDLAQAKERVEPLKELVQKHYNAYVDLDPSVNQSKETREGTERQLHGVQNKLRAMQSESGEGKQALAVFGSKCKALYEAVQKASKKFKGPVAGPVGMYVKVVPGKEKYAKIAEAAIGTGALDRFVVTNHSDLTLMNDLRRKVGCGPRECPLYRIHPKSCDAKYNVPAPPAGVETVSSVISVDNAMAFNFLVDSCNIDTSALTESKESSEKALLVRDSQGKESIRGGKIRKVYFLPKADFWDVRGGNLSVFSNDRTLKQTIGVDRSAAIEATKHEVKTLQQELARNKSEEKGINDAIFKEKKAWNHANKEHSKLTGNIKKMQQKLDELKAEADTSEDVPTIDTSDMENDIQVCEASMENIKKKLSAVGQEVESLQPGITEKKKKLVEYTARNDKIIADMEKVEAKLEDIVKGQSRRQDLVDKIRAKVEQMEQGLVEQEEQVKKAKDKVASALHGARKVQYTYNRDAKMFELKKNNSGEIPPGEEVPLEATEEDLEEIKIVQLSRDSNFFKTKLKNKEKKIEQEKVRRNMSESDPAVAREKYFRAKENLDSQMKQIDAIDNNCKSLQNDLKDRKKRWRQFRSHIAEMTNLGFDEFLNKKGSAGIVEFNHDEQKLDLIVQKDNTDEGSQTKDVKALSGGERSFATLSLLLAIGESLETPFRVMDEFDVFLDPVARKIAMRTLVEVAKEMDHRQFIFITPQDVSSLQTDNKLRIFKMKAPARSKTVGGAQQQTLEFGN